MSLDIDEKIASAHTYADRDAFDELYGHLRREDSVHWTTPQGYNPFWTVSRHADIVAVERAHARWSAADRTVLRSLDREESIRRVTGSAQPMHSMMHMDDPDHRKYRMITQAWFSPQQLRPLSASMQALANRFVDEMVQSGPTIDFGEEIASRYTLRALMNLIGVPEQDEDLMVDITQRFFSPADPTVNQGKPLDLGAELQRAFRYFNELSARRREDPRDDLATLLASAEIDGEPMSDFDRNSYFILIALGGHDTTAITISEMLLALVERPDQWERLRENRSLLPSAIEEGIRWASPANHFMRIAREDTLVGETMVRQGEAVFLCFPSGNFDEEVFDAPADFRIDRSPNRHLGFGFGPHQCLGQHLAKMELTAMFTTLLDRIDSVELIGEPRRLESLFVSGLQSMSIRFQPRPAAPDPGAMN